MKLISKEIFPVEARDKLVEKLGGVDIGVTDIRFALETAERQCFELHKENEKLRAYLLLIKSGYQPISELNASNPPKGNDNEKSRWGR